MIKNGINHYRGKRILFLQGPVGPFFARLARDLQAVDAQVYKINFNGGDWAFFPHGAVSFRGTRQEWPLFIQRFLQQHGIEVVFMFGDCRPLHQIARVIAHDMGLEVGVFEEGYVRPDFFTLERYGVNGYSRLSRDPQFYRALQIKPGQAGRHVGNTFWYCLWWAILYYLACSVLQLRYRNYIHHRPLGLREGLPLLRSAGRKWKYAVAEAGIAARLRGPLSDHYFLVPLQVHNDTQIHVHSAYASVQTFIVEVMQSFAAHAAPDLHLVIKQHPLDRAYHDYAPLIRREAQRLGLDERVLYIHDQHLPTLLHHARGVVVINSTVGLSALYHSKPVKACGTAVYDLPGLTFQPPLHEFWSAAGTFVTDRDLYQRFRQHLIESTQLNGSFFRRLPRARTHCGVRWTRRAPKA